ncbi:hypothetical protein CR513_25009, partial [Mucuna pruriens]
VKKFISSKKLLGKSLDYKLSFAQRRQLSVSEEFKILREPNLRKSKLKLGNDLKEVVESVGDVNLLMIYTNCLWLPIIFIRLIENSTTKIYMIEEKSFMLWHKHSRHIFKEMVERLTKANIPPSLNFDDLVICMDCIGGKCVKTKKKGAIRMFYAKINKTSSGFKHLEMKYPIARNFVKEGFIMVEHIDTDSIVVDPLTKGLKHVVFKRCVENISIVSYYDMFGKKIFLAIKNTQNCVEHLNKSVPNKNYGVPSALIGVSKNYIR